MVDNHYLYIECPVCGFSMWGPGLVSKRSVHRKHLTPEQLQETLNKFEKQKENNRGQERADR